MGKPTLSDQAAERVVSVLRLLKRERFNGNGAALGRALKVSQATVSDLENKRHKPTFVTAQKVADLYGVDVWTLLGETRDRATRATHPNLFTAADLVGDRAPAGARQRVEAAAAQLPDFAVQTWVSMLLDDAHARARQLRPAPPSERAAPEKTQELPIVGKHDPEAPKKSV